MSITLPAYGEFQRAYDVFNAELFEGALPACLITFQRRDHRCAGYFSAHRFGHRLTGDRTDEIAINPVHFKKLGPLEALQTLAHEMCHLWQCHFGKPTKGYHNAEWAEKMQQIGLMPSDTGKPGGKTTGQKMADYVLTGGPFETIANRLLNAEFVAAWYDRGSEILAEAAGEVVAPNMATGANAPDVPAAAAKKRKIKYVCPKCEAKAWGKPGLALMCGTDREDMQPAD